MKLSMQTMKAKALAIVGALSVVSIALSQSAKAQATYEFWYTYTAGSFATLCDLHVNDVISTEDLQEYQKNWMDDDDNLAAFKEAVDAVLEQEAFSKCPLLRY